MACVVVEASSARVFNVMQFSAIVDGTKDNTKRFELGHWNKCSHPISYPIVKINCDYLVPKPCDPRGNISRWSSPVQGSVPNASPMVVQVKDKVKDSTDMSKYPSDEWIVFQYVDGLVVTGGGTFDGQGASAWSLNQYCFCDNKSKRLAFSLKFSFVTSRAIRGIHSVDSKLFHMLFVGSLGKRPKEGDVEGLHVKNYTISGTTNGLRIKTWEDSHRSSASNFTYEDIVMNNHIYIPKEDHGTIFIKQLEFYVDDVIYPCPSRVKINNISFKNIRGTLTSKVAVNLLCSRAFPCKNVELDDIKLEYNDQGEASTASCTNVNEVSAGVQIPPTCL
ncbi:hypothetical protein AMTRI_Chr12g271090 [Amborella trichopoda]